MSEDNVHDGVKLLLARMDSHPEEFLNDIRWAKHYQQYKSLWNDTEKGLFNAKIREIRMKAMHSALLEELLRGR